MRRISAVLSGVNHIFLFDAGKHLIHEFLTFDSGDAEVVVKVIAAHFGLCGRDFLVKVRHILIAVLHNFRHIRRFQISLEDDIHPCATAHGADIDDFIRPDGCARKKVAIRCSMVCITEVSITISRFGSASCEHQRLSEYRHRRYPFSKHTFRGAVDCGQCQSLLRPFFHPFQFVFHCFSLYLFFCSDCKGFQ